MRRRTELMDVISRKLAPYVMLFGLYLIAFAHRSPGGGFQGGVVIASAVILLALGRDIREVERLFPVTVLHALEIGSFIVVLLLAGAGLLVRGHLFAYPGTTGAARWFLFAINLMIGLKVGSGVTLLVLTLFEDDRRRP